MEDLNPHESPPPDFESGGVCHSATSACDRRLITDEIFITCISKQVQISTPPMRHANRTKKPFCVVLAHKQTLLVAIHRRSRDRECSASGIEVHGGVHDIYISNLTALIFPNNLHTSIIKLCVFLFSLMHFFYWMHIFFL